MNDIKQFEQTVKKQILKQVVDAANKIGDYSYSYVKNSYTSECKDFWPLRDSSGKEIVDPETKEKFGDDYSPQALAKLIKKELVKGKESVSITVWVDTSASNDPAKLERAARMIEIFGPRPWTRLKQQLNSGKIAEIIK